MHNRNKTFRYIALISLVIGIAIAVSSFFLAQGKIGIFLDKNGIHYLYDEALWTEKTETYQDITALDINVRDKYLEFYPIEGNEFVVTYRYLGAIDELITTKEGTKLTMRKTASNPMLFTVGGVRVIDEYIRVGYPKNMPLERLKLNYSAGSVDLQNIAVKEDIELATESGNISLQDIKTKNIIVDTLYATFDVKNLEATNKFEILSTGGSESVDEFDTYGYNNISLENVKAATGNFSQASGAIAFINTTFENDIKMPESSYKSFDNFTAKSLEIQNSYGTIELKNMTIAEDINIVNDNSSGNYFTLKADTVKAKNMTIFGGNVELKNIELGGTLLTKDTINVLDVSVANVDKISIEDASNTTIQFANTTAKEITISSDQSNVVLNQITTNTLIASGQGIEVKEAEVASELQLLASYQGINLNNVSATKAKIIAEQNHIEITGGNLRDTQIEAQMGSVNVTAKLLGKTNITAIDQVEVTLHDSLENYDFDITSTSGTIQMNNEALNMGSTYVRETGKEKSLTITNESSNIIITGNASGNE